MPRIGRGRTLSRLQRQQVWKVFERYVEALLRRGKTEWGTVIRDARSLLELKRPPLPYRAVVVDEAQDFHAGEWRLLRAIVPAGPDDLFLVGDAHQRLYGHKIALRACGVNIQGRSSRLRVNYRTTEEIRAWAMAVLEGVEVDDLDGGSEERAGLQVPAVRPEARGPPLRDQARGVGVRRGPDQGAGRPAARRARLPRRPHPQAAAGRLPADAQGAGDRVAPCSTRGATGSGVRLATMHRVKGLEFPVMILAGVNARYMPLPVPGLEGDPVAEADHEDRERSLLFVAATRARDLLIVTGWGTPSPFVPIS